MTQTTERTPPDTERIDRILRSVEHVWKLFPRWTFGQVVEEVLGDHNHGENHQCFEGLADEETELAFRNFLHVMFSGSRDGT